MSILNTFYIIFRSNSDDVIKGNKEIEKSTKDTQKALQNTADTTAEIGKSFVKTVEAAASFAGAFAGFQILKNGIDTADRYNNSLSSLARTLNTTGQAVKSFLQSSAEAGGTREGAIGDILSLNKKYTDAGLTLGDPNLAFDQIRKALRDKDGNPLPRGAQNNLLQAYGINDIGDITRLRDYTDEEYQASRTTDIKYTKEQERQAAKNIKALERKRGAKDNFSTNQSETFGPMLNWFRDAGSTILNSLDGVTGAVVGGLGFAALKSLEYNTIARAGGEFLKGAAGKATVKNVAETASKIRPPISPAEFGGQWAATEGISLAGALGTSAAGLLVGGAAGYGGVSYFHEAIEGAMARYLERDLKNGLPTPSISKSIKYKSGNIGPILPINTGKDINMNGASLPNGQDIINSPAAMNDINRALGLSYLKNAKDTLNSVSNFQGVTGSGGTTNVTIDKILIETQATDSKGIAESLESALVHHMNLANANFDNGRKR